MKIRIDKDSDIVRILFRNVAIEESSETRDGVIYDYDADGAVVGMEFLNASQKFGSLDKLEHPATSQHSRFVKIGSRRGATKSRYQPLSK